MCTVHTILADWTAVWAVVPGVPGVQPTTPAGAGEGEEDRPRDRGNTGAHLF